MMTGRFGRKSLSAFCSACLALAAPVVAHAEEKVRVVMTAKLGVPDPIATTDYTTLAFGYLIYDTLVSMDSKGEFKPQLLDNWKVSSDGLTYQFTLRNGIKFSDGTAITGEDCVASLKRWWEADALGRRLKAATKELKATGEKTFELVLARPFGHVISAIGKPSSNLPVIMPARIASATPSKEAVKDFTGSGPFVFDVANWSPGNTATFTKNPHYVPRSEPADGLAGGKVVNIDKVELVSIPDSATQIAALQAGEIDFIQSTPYDFIDILDANKDTTVPRYEGIDMTLGAVVINHLTPPFDNVKVRRVIQALAMTDQYMAGLGLKDGMWLKDCYSLFMCGSTYGTNAGKELLPERSIASAKKLLADSGYKGELVRILLATSTTDINNLGLVLEGLMRQAGFNVEVQAADWPTVSKNRWSKKPVSEGGWSLIPITWSGYDMGSPFTNYRIANNCSDGYAGWACVEEMSKLIDAFEAESDLQKSKALVDKIQTIAHQNVHFVAFGQYTRSSAYRSDLKNLLKVGVPVFWNVKRQR